MADESMPLDKWLTNYFERLQAFRFWFDINLKELPVEGDTIFVRVYPWTEGRDRRQLYDIARYSQSAYEIPTCFFNESLDHPTANRLATSLSAISMIQNISIENAFAFAATIMLLCMDYKLYPHIPNSLLFGTTFKELYDEYDGDAEEARTEYEQRSSSPIFKIQSWLEVWDQGGTFINKQLFEIPEGKRGIIDYRVIPPAWVEREDEERLPVSIQAQFVKLHPESIKSIAEMLAQILKSMNCPPEQIHAIESDYLIQKDASGWRIIYNRHITTFNRDYSGLAYIAELMLHPNYSYNALELYAKVNGDSSKQLSASKAMLDQEILSTDVATVEAVDESTMKDCRGRLKKLAIDRAEAVEEGDSIVIGEIDDEIQKIKDYLNGSINVKGKSRTQKDDIDVKRRAIDNAIKLVYSKIKQIELIDFLKSHIHIGRKCQYTPLDSISWDIII